MSVIRFIWINNDVIYYRTITSNCIPRVGEFVEIKFDGTNFVNHFLVKSVRYKFDEDASSSNMAKAAEILSQWRSGKSTEKIDVIINVDLV